MGNLLRERKEGHQEELFLSLSKGKDGAVESSHQRGSKKQEERKGDKITFSLSFSVLKILKLEGRHIHCLFNLSIVRIKDEDAFP